MEGNINILKGLHPGVVLAQELKKRNLSKGRFALSIDEYPQTLSAIMNEKRSMNTALALRIEHTLNLEEGYFMILQVYYDIKQEKRKQQAGFQPDLSMLRPVLFWDTKMENIDWNEQKKAIINRVFERGNKEEKKEITRFYGKETIDSIRKNDLNNA